MPLDKIAKEGSNKKLVRMNKDKSGVDKFLGDISKCSASKQIFIGASSGW